MPKILLTCGVLAAALLATVNDGRAATFRVCNEAREHVRLAIGYEDVDLGPVSEGWWPIGIGDCVNIAAPDRVVHQYYFVFAKGERGGSWFGFDSKQQGEFCVTPWHFKFVNRDIEKAGKLRCRRYGASNARFRRLDTFVDGKPIPNFTFSLTRRR
jgi:uncharacterized membrane protein